ncbi:MAG: hypothetical protein WBL67_19235 [Nitrososphaeraceae archaeon]
MRSYDSNLDRAILKIVHESKNGEISSGELKRKVEECCRNGKNISSALFSFHLKEMLIFDRKHSRYLVSPVLRKRDYGRGRNIFYSLTYNARIRLNLKLPILSEDSGREKAYQLFLNFMAFQNVPANNNKSVIFSSEKEFEYFLSKIHISRKELKQTVVKSKIIAKQIGISKNEQKKIKEPVEVYTFPREQYHKPDITIYRINYLWSSQKEGSFYYIYQLPGISINEALQYDQTEDSFWYNKPTRGEATEYFQLLEQEGLIKSIRSSVLLYLDEIRYDIANGALRKFIIECTLLHRISVERMLLTWKNFRLPTKEEVKWDTIFWGDTRTKIILEELRQYQSKRDQQLKQLPPKQQNNRNEQQEKEIKCLERGVQRRFERITKDYSKVLADYSSFADVLLEWVYPSLLRELQKNDKI